DLEEVGGREGEAGPDILIDDSLALLIGGDARPLVVTAERNERPRQRVRGRSHALDVAVVQDLGIGGHGADAKAVAVEQGTRGRGAAGAGLGSSRIELCDLEVAVA